MTERRSLEPQRATTPATGFLEWKSNDKKFRFYNKESQENEFVELPFKFMKLTEFHTIKGFHDDSLSGIFSNEVKYIGKEPFKVSSFKGGHIAKGIYRDIKGDIISAGGHYTKSVYIMTPDLKIWNIQMKGSVVAAWGEFSNIMRQRLDDEWIVVKRFEDKKKGATQYCVPVFDSEKSLSDSEWEKAKENFGILSEFFKERSEFQDEKTEVKEEIDAGQNDSEDDMRF